MVRERDGGQPRKPGAHPSVRWYSRPVPPSDSVMPSARSSSTVLSIEKRKSGARDSVS
jgi:hypothetical protein